MTSPDIESEELREAYLISILEDLYHAKDEASAMQTAVKTLKQWRTKSLLALIGEDEVDPNEGTAFYSGVMVERNKLRAVLRAALQDIKKKVEL